MTSCFKNPNKKYLSAKDYTIKKRRKTIFCNLRNNFKNNVDNSIFVKQLAMFMYILYKLKYSNLIYEYEF